MEYGLIGEKLGHSFSKTIHALLGNYDYSLKELSQSELTGFMDSRDFKAINVTIPYKQAVIPFLSEISEEAKKIGSVNTVVNKNGLLFGYNTDMIGLSMLIKRVLAKSGRKSLSGLDVMIAGTGGTALTAAAASEMLGARSITLVSRSKKDGTVTYEEAEKELKNAGFIINCTPVGMFPKIDGCPLRLEAYKSLVGVVDVIYNPLKTLLIREAEKRNIPAEGGLYMLVAQAVAAYSYFFDKPLDISLTDSVYLRVLSEKENTVLVGMPSSGKTTVGRIISERLGKIFIDTDDEIIKEIKMSISEFFAEYGEESFREVEAEVISRLSAELSGAVIATGGGAVLRSENVFALKGNGRLFWLDRPLEMLMPTSDRPTASSREAIKKRYEERHPIYRAVCDERIPSDVSPEEAANTIISFYTSEKSVKEG